MSKVSIQFEKKLKPEGKYSGVPLYCTLGEGDLNVLIKDDDADEKYRLVNVENGHVQCGYTFNSVEEFYNQNKDVRVVDIKISATYK